MMGPDWNGQLARIDIDYISDNGKNLEEAITRDGQTAKKLREICAVFHEADEKAREAIEAEWAQIKA